MAACNVNFYFKNIFLKPLFSSIHDRGKERGRDAEERMVRKKELKAKCGGAPGQVRADRPEDRGMAKQDTTRVSRACTLQCMRKGDPCWQKILFYRMQDEIGRRTKEAKEIAEYDVHHHGDGAPDHDDLDVRFPTLISRYIPPLYYLSTSIPELE